MGLGRGIRGRRPGRSGVNLLEAADDLPEDDGVSRSKAAAPGTLLEAAKRGRYEPPVGLLSGVLRDLGDEEPRPKETKGQFSMV